jgi:hypothetical protein
VVVEEVSNASRTSGAALRTAARWTTMSRKIGRVSVPKENRMSAAVVGVFGVR